MTEPKRVYVCSLPGAGGMALQAILAQNPRLFVRGHSPLFELLHANLQLLGSILEDSDDANLFREDIVRGILAGAEVAAEDRVYVEKTGTGPLEYRELLTELVPDHKVVLFVRDLRAQCAQLMFRSASADLREAFALGALATSSQVRRVLETPAMAVGIKRITELVKAGVPDNVTIISYEQLCAFPQATISLLYNALGLEPFEHSFASLDTPPPSLVRSEMSRQLRPTLSSRNDRWLAYFSDETERFLFASCLDYFRVFYPNELSRDPLRIQLPEEQARR